jgi:hypothetical protein
MERNGPFHALLTSAHPMSWEKEFSEYWSRFGRGGEETDPTIPAVN